MPKAKTEKDVRTLRRRLFFDIETSPNIGFFFEAGFKKNISTDSIIKERAIICICYKWEDEKEVSYLKWDSKQSDKAILEKFIAVANTANELVGHNGDRFDLAWIRTRCLFHRIEMFPMYVTIDTLKISRSKFKFNSNRLDYISSFLGMGKKIKTEFSLWSDIVLRKDKVAMEKMIKYCQMDVILLEKVYKQLAPYVPHKSHYGVTFGQHRGSCPECGSDELVISKYRTTAMGTRKVQFKCKTCNRYHEKVDK